MESTARQFADAGGRPLHARVWTPAAPEQLRRRAPIVLLHDSLGAVELWRDFPALLCLQTQRTVIAYDRLGFGNSAAHPGRLGPGFIAEEAHASVLPLLDQLGLEQVILFGHSVGGGMAVAAATRLPDRVVALITESAQAFVEALTLQGIRAARDNFSDPAQLARLAKYHGNDPDRARWVLDAWIETWLAPNFADWSLDTDLERLHCPLLAMHGDGDEFGSALQPQRIAALAGARGGVAGHLMFEACGHVPHREKPALVLDAVQQFLDRHVPA
ncbi:alpha/beta fold hydrolase [Herbaspirillum robiniae]|uniref:alpha/beta fold hydrolase n=1 Tax=Herbaspirillum robiniae TaxID=2014887 RepID=UPI003D77C6DF